ncbi:pSer/pThr/pTyr-binding forkhead associated (FHA) protein [Roseimicrobium gellanilyticum]|uniref:PSer/pThr/pTyr-binding forkhead associated (FHA) protein n=1 Tax=Roseimicrobium gellanilyticum TaxID=748857 RepID=A0A366HF81_9BACT|nr:FHA domain-containing protein [Roseimicrobium gellanilyticum]RBP41242.1 pSer/pThr/pTyr-binding forkhead associated (FHA) protein [Roseimicrobium gellanilyticum]
MKITHISRLLATFLGAALVASPVHGADFLINRDVVEIVTTPSSGPPQTAEAKLTVRLTNIDDFKKAPGAQATVGGKEAPVTLSPANEGKTLIYFLLDVSEQKGVSYVKEETAAVQEMTDALLADDKAQTLFQVGIGTIGSQHKNLAFALPTKDGRSKILEGVANDKPEATSEIYRCALEAIDQFKLQQGGERKVLYILSSGKSTDTDKQKSSADALIAAARKEGIVVFAIGFSKTEAGMSDWQELRRVAKETGGGFIETVLSIKGVPTNATPRTIQELHGRLKSAAVVTVDLKNAPSGKQPMVINLELNSGGKIAVEKEIEVPQLPVPPAPPKEDPAEKKDPSVHENDHDEGKPVPPPIPDATPVKGLTDQPWFLPALVGGGVLVMGLLSFLIFKLTRPREEEEITIVDPTDGGRVTTGPTVTDEGRDIISGGGFDHESKTQLVIGWLEEFDDSATPSPVRRHEITKGNFTIGRSSDSTLRFLDDSVSVHHANIHRRSDRSLEITDLRSANQTRVNGKAVEHCVLKDGDKIQLGKVRLMLVLNNSSQDSRV